MLFFDIVILHYLDISLVRITPQITGETRSSLMS